MPRLPEAGMRWKVVASLRCWLTVGGAFESQRRLNILSTGEGWGGMVGVTKTQKPRGRVVGMAMTQPFVSLVMGEVHIATAPALCLHANVHAHAPLRSLLIQSLRDAALHFGD